jgi:hypothetical protein
MFGLVSFENSTGTKEMVLRVSDSNCNVIRRVTIYPSAEDPQLNEFTVDLPPGGLRVRQAEPVDLTVKCSYTGRSGSWRSPSRGITTVKPAAVAGHVVRFLLFECETDEEQVRNRLLAKAQGMENLLSSNSTSAVAGGAWPSAPQGEWFGGDSRQKPVERRDAATAIDIEGFVSVKTEKFIIAKRCSVTFIQRSSALSPEAPRFVPGVSRTAARRLGPV